MGTFLRIIIFGGCALSLSVYAYRGYKRWIAPGDPAIPDPTASPSASSSSAAATRSPAAPLPASAPADKKPRRGMGFTNPTLSTDIESSGSESLVQAVIREELARKQGGDTGSADGATTAGRRGLFAGAGGTGAADRVSVAAALTGVRLPGDLVPLVGSGEADPHHVAFLSAELSAAEIGRQIGDELERLGFDVSSESDVVAIATKGAVTLRVTLHPDARHERLDGAARYPTAPPNSVVVDFAT